MSFICPNCGETNRETAASCVKCGYDMINWPSVVPGEPEEPSYPPAPIGCIRNELWHSVLIAMCCCLIPGVIAIFYSAAARTRREAGDYQGALEASNAANTWNMWGIILGLVSVILKAWLGSSGWTM